MARKKRSLGFSFPDELTKVISRQDHFQKNGTTDWADSLLPNFHPGQERLYQKSSWRVAFFIISCLVLFFIIFLRLFHLQIVQGRTNKELADNNRIQVKLIHAPRGVIFDRNGIVLAANSPAFRITTKASGVSKSRFVTREQALEWEVKNDPRLADLEVDNLRTYPKGEQFAHLLGYMGEISDAELQQEEFKNYRPGDRIGKSGIEATYEKLLRGIDGGEIIEVDSQGRKVRTLRLVSPIAGQNIYLSAGASLQERLYQLMQETLQKTGSCCGAAVAQDPNNGKILALVSLPSFDPNVFSKNLDDGSIGEIFSHKDSPILNRVIAGIYPPGSTFKIVTSLAALASGVKANASFEDTGIMYLGTYKFTNWYFNQYGKVEGAVNLAKALERSNDTYFYKVAQIIGEKAIIDWARKLRLGGKLEIDLPGEEVGLVPDDAWKQKTYKQPWYPGDTLHMSIGQGFVLTTPLQVLGITSYIANNGKIYKPGLLLSDKPNILASNLLGQNQINLVKKGLELVPKPGGTAWPFFTFPITTAGKTGTAEFGDPKNKTHAWYTSYAPVENPQITLTILVEAGGEGSSVAAPIAKEIYRWYFSPDKNKLIQDVYTQATDSSKNLGE
ncbi:penicillin-binding protein 2 [Candidatus Daviesbacteria bacterium]|nr:penicillin-binding protein 2 [Candidatus Daviesbacteria bacterium]